MFSSQPKVMPLMDLKKEEKEILAKLESTENSNEQLSQIFSDAAKLGLHNVFDYMLNNKKISAHLTTDDLNQAFITAVKENHLNIIGRLLANNFIPNKEQLLFAIQNSLDAGHDKIAILLINFSVKNNWNIKFELNFKINGLTPLAYAIKKNDPILVEALLRCDIDLNDLADTVGEEKENEPNPNLMTFVFTNLIDRENPSKKKVNQACFKILVLLLEAGADIYLASNGSIQSALLHLKDDLKDDKDRLSIFSQAEFPFIKYEPSEIRDYIIDKLWLKSKFKFRNEITSELIGNYYLCKFNPELSERILALDGNQIIQCAHKFIIESISVFHPPIEWVLMLIERGLAPSIVLEIIKEKTFTLPSIEEEDFEEMMKCYNTPGLQSRDFSFYGSYLCNKLKKKNISQNDLDDHLCLLPIIIELRKDKNEIMLEYTCMLIAAGAKPIDYDGWNINKYREKFIADFKLANFNHFAVDVFSFIAKSNNLTIVDLMLELGVRFNNEYSLRVLKDTLAEVKENKMDDMVEKLEAVILKEERIQNAKKGFQHQKANFHKVEEKEEGVPKTSKLKKETPPDWIDHQITLRPKLLSAIGAGDVARVIDLISQGADPNFGGDGMQNEYVKVGCAIYNVKGMTPSHFACFILKDEDAANMFELLQEMGANIDIINEYTQLNFGKKLIDLYKNSWKEKLLIVICDAELGMNKEQRNANHFPVPRHLQLIQSRNMNQVPQEDQDKEF